MNRAIAFLLVTMFAAAMFAQSGAGIDSTHSTEHRRGTDGQPPPFAEATGVQEVGTFMDDLEFWNSVVVIVFGLIIIGIVLFKFRVKDMDADSLIRLFTLTLVIIASMYLIAAGWDNQQTAPAFGILGTVAGYLLGKEHSKKPNNQ